MAERDLIVKVVGDASSYTKALNQATQSTKAFGRQMRQAGAGRTPLDQFTNLQRVQAGIENLRRTETQLAATVLQGADAQNQADQARTRSVGSLAKLGVASVVAFNALQHLRDGLITTGDAAFTTEGRIKNFAAALSSGDIIGGFQALAAQESRLAPDLEKAVALLKQVGDEASRVSLSDVVGDTDKFHASLTQATKDMVSIGIPIDAAKQKTAAWEESLKRAAGTTGVLGRTFETVFGRINEIIEETTKKVEKAVAARKQGLAGLAELPPGIGAAIAREQGTTGSEEGQLKVLRQARGNIERRIAEARKLGKTRDVSVLLKTLQEQLNQTDAQITAIFQGRADAAEKQRREAEAAARKAEAAARKVAAAARAAAQAQREAFAAQFGFLQLRLDRAKLTRGLKDDLKLLDDEEKAVRAQIKVEGRTVALERELFRIEQDRAAIAEERKRRKKGALQARQFRTLGLTAEGDELTPTVANLQKQLKSLTERVAGTKLDTPKTKGLLANIRRVLMDPLDTATVETREKVKDLLAVLRGELDKGLKGPLTKTTGLNTKKILEGLGLDSATENEIRSRLSGFNSAGRALAPGGGTATTGGGLLGDGRPIIVESHTVLQVDGATIAKLVTRNQQKTRRRNPQQKRGPNRIGA